MISVSFHLFLKYLLRSEKGTISTWQAKHSVNDRLIPSNCSSAMQTSQKWTCNHLTEDFPYSI